MNEIKLLDNYPATKFDQQMLANDIMLPVLEGEVDPIETYVKAKALIETLKIVVEDDRIKDLTISEVEKHGKEATFNRAKLVVKESGVRYDYLACGDSEYQDLQAELKILQDKIKSREKFLKGIQSKTTIVNDESGEIHEVYPPVKSGTLGVTVTFNKER